MKIGEVEVDAEYAHQAPSWGYRTSSLGEHVRILAIEKRETRSRSGTGMYSRDVVRNVRVIKALDVDTGKEGTIEAKYLVGKWEQFATERDAIAKAKAPIQEAVSVIERFLGTNLRDGTWTDWNTNLPSGADLRLTTEQLAALAEALK